MTIDDNARERARAWVLIRAESPQSTARQLYEKLGHAGGNRWVVVRADIVDYHYNILVPVDAESPDVLQEVYGMIQELTGAKETAIMPVVGHTPFPPHVAHGFVTKKEVEAGGIDTEIGRLGHSPGHNAWG
jgi:hypothetical protein